MSKTPKSEEIQGGERDFKGIWIPKEIWLDPDLSMQEKVFLAEIDSLDGKEGCYASNDYFSKFFGISKDRCKDVISSLSKKGKIEVILSKVALNKDRRIIRGVWAKMPRPLGRKSPYRRGEKAPQITKGITKHINQNLATGVAEDPKPEVETSEGAVVNLVMAHFEAVNPMHERLYANKGQRAALERIIRKFGVDKAIGIVDSLPASNADRWAPTITTPVELEHRMGKLVIYWKTRGQESRPKEREMVGM